MNTTKYYQSVDELIRARTVSHADDVLISHQTGAGSYQNISGASLDRLTRIAARRYRSALCSHAKDGIEKVALIGTSTLDYYIAFLAAQRAGFTTFFISPRLAEDGFEHLLKTTDCKAAIVAPSSLQIIKRVSERIEGHITVAPLIMTDEFLQAEVNHDDCSTFPVVEKHDAQEFIIHSGGTTGLPKPVPLKPASWLAQAADIAGRMPQVDTLVTLPLFHSFGLATLLRCLVNGKKLTILNASRPVTASAISASLSETSSKALVTVPYILKFFTEMEGGVNMLAELSQVIAAGSAIPDELGDQLVSAGVKIFHLYGQTESGALMEPSRDQWNWVTPLPHAEPYLKFEPAADGLYHLIILPGLKAKVYSNRPDGSYETKDLFERHPADGRKWKFTARQDDLIVLVNGEKADPTPLENAVCQSHYVRAAVAFGAQREALGLIVIASQQAKEISPSELQRKLQPYLEQGNAKIPDYAKIPLDAVLIKPADTAFPSTDKGTVIRAQFLKQFADDIQAYYDKRERPSQSTKDLDICELHRLVRQIVRDSLRIAASTQFLDTDDFFGLGMDSLQASNVRSRLLRVVNLHGRILETNAIFEHPTVEHLVTYLFGLQNGLECVRQDSATMAQKLVQKYSDFGPSQAGCLSTKASCVLLTGATGFIGAHILHNLLLDPDVTEVHCLLRSDGRSSSLARDRVLETLRKYRLYDEVAQADCFSKLRTHRCDFRLSHLGLPEFVLDEFRIKATHIIHNAWAVNFNQSLQSFESSCLRPTATLLGLASSSKLKVKPLFTFVSSIAVALRDAQNDSASHIATENLVSFSSVEPMGYAESKWVGEQIVAAAAESTGVSTQVVRVGQVCGDSVHGIWNPTEAIPITVQSALSIRALPAAREEANWLPVDIVGKALVQLTLRKRDASKHTPDFSVFHVVNKECLSWHEELLPYLKKNGLDFEAVEPKEWLRMLEASEQDVAKNPPIKLLDFFRKKYLSKRNPTVAQPQFDVSKAELHASVLRDGYRIDEELVGKWLKYWMVEAWNARK